MTAWFSEAHRLHAGLKEFSCGQWLEGFELPVRAQAVRERFLALRLGAVREPMDRGLVPLARVHDADCLDFLPHAWTPWSARGRRHPALPMFWRAAATTPPRHRSAPRHIDGQLVFYSQDAECSIVAGTWTAAYWSAQCALAAAVDLLAGARSSFAVCRPPRHHATARAMGGFCGLNNVAIAAHHQER